MPPWLVLAVVIALVIALVYQISRRRFGWWLLLYWIVILAGLLAGEIVAESAGWNLSRLGDLRLGPDLVGIAVALTCLRIFRL